MTSDANDGLLGVRADDVHAVLYVWATMEKRITAIPGHLPRPLDPHLVGAILHEAEQRGLLTWEDVWDDRPLQKKHVLTKKGMDFLIDRRLPPRAPARQPRKFVPVCALSPTSTFVAVDPICNINHPGSTDKVEIPAHGCKAFLYHRGAWEVARSFHWPNPVKAGFPLDLVNGSSHFMSGLHEDDGKRRLVALASILRTLDRSADGSLSYELQIHLSALPDRLPSHIAHCLAPVVALAGVDAIHCLRRDDGCSTKVRMTFSVEGDHAEEMRWRLGMRFACRRAWLGTALRIGDPKRLRLRMAAPDFDWIGIGWEARSAA